MTKLCKRLGVGLAAAALLLGLAGLQGLGQADAQTNPPATFAGTVMIDGEDAPSGTAITAMMGETTCATGQTGRGLNNSAIDANRYALQIDQDACSGEISFMVGDMMAAETAMMADGVGQVGTANLTAMAATPTPTPEPTAMPTEEPAEPTEPEDGDGMEGEGEGMEEPTEPDAMETETAMATDTPDTAMTDGSGTDDVPDVSDTGTGLASGAGSATTTLAAALGALTLALTLGGVALARRRG